MANSVTPYAIVPIPDPITGGVGAPVMVATIVNAMWDNSAAQSKMGVIWLDQALAYTDPPPQMTVPPFTPDFVIPTPPELKPSDMLDGELLYDEKVQELLQFITSQFTLFIQTYFPNPQYYQDAMDWCHRAYTTGGTGINANVEQQLWERARAKILGDSQRAEDEIVSTWASKRWPIPTGALQAQLIQARLESDRKLAEQSRDISIKSFEAELENIKFAIKTVVDQWQIALNAAGDYIKTLMMGPQVAMQLATGLTGMQNQFNQAMTALYAAEVSAVQPLVQLQTVAANMQLETGKANLQSKLSSIDQKVKAATSGAQMAAQQASAGLNAINSQSSVSGSDSTTTQK